MILVTGATGILGAQIIRQLHIEKKSVRAIKRNTSDNSWTNDINHSIDWIEADILDLLKLDDAFKGVTHVIHCAAMVSFDNSNNEEMYNINVEGTKNILALCEKHQIQKLIYISSIASLGGSSNNNEITEESKWENSPLKTAYATSKYLAELEVWRAQEEGLSTVILNPSVILGPGKWQNSSMKLFNQVKKGFPFYPSGSINYVDVRDVALISKRFLFDNTEAERFILNAGNVSYKRFFSLVRTTLNKKGPFLKISSPLAIFAVMVLKVLRILTGIKSSLSKEAVLLSQLNIFYSSYKIEKHLNYKFRLIEDSITWTCKQMGSKVSKH
jgi:nucleoside-diphosphate-sugar epimerase